MSDPYLLPLAEVASSYATGAVPWFQNSTKTCQVFFTTVAGHPTFAFGGTETVWEWIVDFTAPDVPFFQHPQVGPVQLGYWYDIQTAVTAIQAKLLSLGKPSYLLCGHSKGAGEAIMAAMALTLLGLPPLATRAYEPPRVGTTTLTSFLAGQDIAWTTTQNAAGPDRVTQVPFWPEWEHQGKPISLAVPDALTLAQKHEIPAVLAAIRTMP